MAAPIPPEYDTDDADPLVDAPALTAPPPPKSYECTACLRRVAARVTRCPCCNQIATWQPSDEPPEVRKFKLARPAPQPSFFGRGLSHVPAGLVSAWMSGGPKVDARISLPGAGAKEAEREGPAKARPRLLANVEYEKRDRFTTGIIPVDIAFGGKDDPGIPIGASYMLASPPNAGKSSIALRICAAIAQRYGVPVLYVTTPDEMGVDMVAEYARERGIWREYPSAARFLQVAVAETVEESIALVDEVDAPFYVLDSTNGGLTTSNPTVSGSKDSILLYISKLHAHRCGRKIAKWKEAPGRTGLILAHGTKDGDMSGPLAARHNVDGTFLLEYFDPATGWALEPRARKEWVRLIQEKSRVSPPPPQGLLLAFYTDQKRGPVPAQPSTE